MKIALRLLTAALVVWIFSSCGPQPPDVQFVRQKIPIDIQSGKPVTIEISSLSGDGVNDVGIQCAPEVWNTLTNGNKTVQVRLKSSNKPKTEISGIDPTSSGTAFLGYITNTHYLFYIGGEYHAKASSVEITFPNAPPGTNPRGDHHLQNAG